MKIVKKIIAIASIMLASNVVSAQVGVGMINKANSTEEQAKVESKELAKKLGLNEEQQTSVYNSALQFAKEKAANSEKYKSDKTQLDAANTKANKTYETNVEKVLTAEQKTKYESLLKEKAETKLKLK